MGKIVIITNPRLKRLQAASGKSLLVDIEEHGTSDAEMYQNPGIYNKPQDGAVGVKLEISGMNIIVGAHDYKVDEDIEAGETLIYSYDDSGSILAKILLDASGNVVINDGSNYAARVEDAVQSTSAEDSTFWTWVTSVSSALSLTAPTSLTGKITEGTEKVLLP